MIRYASVCSGVEAASLAWRHLGWEPVFFSEIDKFPCAVLNYRFPDVPNFGDMTKIKPQPNGDIKYGTNDVRLYDGKPIDLLVGGTPCQSFSVAGKREGLRGVSGLALDYIRLAYELAAYCGLRWIIWENVPGVFSSEKGEDFGAFLSGLTGAYIAVPKRKWGNAGIVAGATDGNFGVAYRVLDAQYTRVPRFPFAIPQRRRRVFLVGFLGDWRRAAEVLFDGESLFGNAKPRREAVKGIAEGFAGGSGVARGMDGYNQCETGRVSMSISAAASDNHHIPCVITNSNGEDVMPTITTEHAHMTSGQLERGGGTWWNGEIEKKNG